MSKGQQAARVQEIETGEVELEDGTLEVEKIRNWLTTYLGRLLEMPADSVATDATFQSFGLDSAAAVGLSGDLGRWLKVKLEPTLAYDYPTIDALAEHLAATFGKRA